MVNDKEITKAFTNFRSAAQRATAGGSQLTDPCAVWRKLKPSWDAVIQALKALGTLIPLARQAATAMEKVRDLMAVLCP